LTADIHSSGSQPLKHRAFASFSSRDFRIFFFAATAAMVADNIEHVITYLVMFQKFHSPALGGFAVISHWAPYLFLAAVSGRLADRFDIRRLIQVGMLLFIGVSITWGIHPTVRKAASAVLRHRESMASRIFGRPCESWRKIRFCCP
jgi:MFS family permease